MRNRSPPPQFSNLSRVSGEKSLMHPCLYPIQEPGLELIKGPNLANIRNGVPLISVLSNFIPASGLHCRRAIWKELFLGSETT
jgi:hypothetical protein